MSTENEPTGDESQADQPAEVTDVAMEYAAPSGISTDDSTAKLQLFGNVKRDPVRFEAKVRNPIAFREALLTLHAVVASDFRYVPKDRTAFLAWQRMRRESANMSAWAAQQAYFSWLLRNDPLAFLILDPVITVHPDKLLFEVFSKDEGAYAALSFDQAAFDVDGDPAFGTTNIDFSDALRDGVQQMRSFRETVLAIQQESTSVQTTAQETVLEKKIKVPDAWLRGFLQVQSAATLPRESFSLSRLDLYNILRHLRMNRDQKGKRRGLRVELVPGEKPRVVLEPWETVVETSATEYSGSQARVLRIWGRRRLMLIQRLLPFVERVDVHTLGSGLPGFWVFRCEQFTLTLGITGFTAANWSQTTAFDLLLPRKTQGSKELTSIVKHLSKTWSATVKELEAGTKLKGAELLEALQNGCQIGQLMYDVADDRYRLRPLTEAPLDLERLRYRNRHERLAHDLVSRKAAVRITQENRIFGTGIEITGHVEVAEDKRDYRPQILLGDDGFVTKTECTCRQYREQGLKAGPCPHLIALRLFWAETERKRKSSSRSRNTITVETRTYSKRSSAGEEVYQVTLDRTSLRVRWGMAGQPQRQRSTKFNSVDDARTDYLELVERLTSQGFLDSSL